MALDKARLKGDLQKMMEDAVAHSWTTAQVASAMADAIDRYSRSADVVGVQVQQQSQTLQQTGKGRLA